MEVANQERRRAYCVLKRHVDYNFLMKTNTNKQKKEINETKYIKEMLKWWQPRTNIYRIIANKMQPHTHKISRKQMELG